MNKLKFAKGNAKLGKNTAIFSLPAGHTCTGAKDCLARAHKVTGKITDGKDIKFRCYAASGENLFRNIRISRWRNFEMLKGKSVKDMADLIDASLPMKNIKLVRIHSSGDFFSQAYFDAWLDVARRNPGLIFYGYTKALPFWIYRRGVLPANFKLVASYGGKFDFLIKPNKLKSATVFEYHHEADAAGLEVDHDDSHCWRDGKDFALLVHGTQPPGSSVGKAVRANREEGIGGYKADYFQHYAK
jgi:hypothetical protein